VTKHKALLAAIQRFAEAGSIENRAHALRQHPELLAPETDVLLNEIETDLQAQGMGQAVETIGRIREFLDRCRLHGIDQAFEQDRKMLELVSLRQLVGVGTMAYERYVQSGDRADLDLALRSLRRAHDQWPGGSPHRASIANNLSGIYRASYERSGNEDDLEDAIAFGIEAVASSPTSQEKFERHVNLASALLVSFIRRARNDHLRDAIELLVPAEAALTRLGEAWRQTAHNLAGALRQRAKLSGDLDDINRAIELHGDAARAAPDGTAEAVLYYGGLANAYFKPCSPERARLLNNLGIALSTKYEIELDQSVLDEAIRQFRSSLDILPPPAPEAYGTLVNLGGYLSARYRHTMKDDDFEEAMRCFTQAQGHLDGKPDLAGAYDNQAGAHLTRFNVLAQEGDLDAAVTLWKRSLALPDSPGLEMDRKRSLAAALSQRYSRHGCREDLDHARALFEETIGKPSANPDTELRSALTWGHWAFDRAMSETPNVEAWHEAAKAFDIARAATDRLLRLQITRKHQADWLAQAQHIPVRHAFALVKSGQPERAVEALEAGRSVFLAEALERNRADLEQLAVIGHGSLHRYRAAVTAMRLAEREVQAPAEITGIFTNNAARLRIAGELQASIASIREVPGFEDFLRVLTFAELRVKAATAPLVYLLVTEAGGLALIVSEYGVCHVPLSCTSQILHDWLVTDRRGEGPSGYLLEAFTNQRGLRGTLEAMLPEIGKQLIKPVAAALNELLKPPPDQKPLVRLIPTGPLTMLPLHAANYVAADGTSGSLLDDFSVSYLPSARVLRRPAGAQPNSDLGRMVVGDPAPLPDQFKPLRYARFEAAVVSALAPNSFPPLIGNDATADAVHGQWGRAESAHLACHGIFDMRSPLQSALMLAGGKFTLGETMTELSAGRGPREVVLSACQTALTEFMRLPEEVIGFPVGLIQAGAETVIGTLWSVNDWSTSLLMTKYATERLHCSSAEALRRAQVWLRDSGAEELARFCREICRMVSPADAQAMRLHLAALTLRPRETRALFGEPYYWAGFTCWGMG